MTHSKLIKHYVTLHQIWFSIYYTDKFRSCKTPVKNNEKQNITDRQNITDLQKITDRQNITDSQNITDRQSITDSQNITDRQNRFRI